MNKIKNKLYNILGEDTIRILKENKVILAGGALTSLFSNKPINDFDLYFRNKSYLLNFISIIYSIDNGSELINALFDEDIKINDIECSDISPFSILCNSLTERSILLYDTENDNSLQAIYFSYVNDAYEIFEHFDFTINMVAFDFSTEQFVMHDDFIYDLAQRRLVINTNTDYPIITQQRIAKYIERGYNISIKEQYKLSLAINKLEINSWEDIEDQLNGFYGIDVSELFDKTKEFSIENALEMLSNINDIPKNNYLQRYEFYDIVQKISGNVKMPTKFYKLVKIYEDDTIRSYNQFQFKWEYDKLINGGKHGLWAYIVPDDYDGFHIRNNKSFKLAIIEIEIVSGYAEFVVDKQISNTVKIYGDVKLISHRILNDVE